MSREQESSRAAGEADRSAQAARPQQVIRVVFSQSQQQKIAELKRWERESAQTPWVVGLPVETLR